MEWRLSEDGEVVERECLLFEAGSYPDKGVTLSEDDLRTIAANSAATIPVKIEHLAESPFDSALGVMTRLRVIGSQLWGTLRQPIEAWRFAQRAGAKALSVALDVAGRRIVETSFVRHPRIANAQVFCETAVVQFRTARLFEERKGAAETMASVRQLAAGLIATLHNFLGTEVEETEQVARFAEAWAQERAQLRAERAENRIVEWKRSGRLRATERMEQIARTLLMQDEGNAVRFDGESVPVSALFAAFVEGNGPVIPLGEMMPVARSEAGRGAGSAGMRLTALAQERARQEGIGYVQAFTAAAAAHPDLAQAAREE